MLQRLRQIDLEIMQLINQKWSNPFLDGFIPWLRYQQIWYPFYIFLFALALLNFGKRGAWWMMTFIATAGVTDVISSKLIKKSIQRIRPCNDPDVLDLILLRIPKCSGGFSFTSSHAANHFALAMFVFITMRPVFGNKVGWVFLWSAAISYAQVYVGVHYPFDITFGMIVGSILGGLFGLWFQKVHGLTLQQQLAQPARPGV